MYNEPMKDIDKIKDKLSLTCANDILSREYNKHYKKKVLLSIEIALQKELPSDEISAKKPLAFDRSGKAISYTDITRKEYIEILEKRLDDVNLNLKVIESLFEE